MMAFVGGATSSSSSSPRSSPRQQQMNGGGDHHAQQQPHQQRKQHVQQHRQRQQKRQQQGQKGEMMDEPGDDHIIELEDDDDDDVDNYDDDIDGGSGGDSYNDPIPAVKSYSDNSRRGKDNNDNSSNGFSGSNKHRSASNTGLITKTAGELRCDATNNSRNINNMIGGGMMMGGGGDQHQAAVKLSLNQKNHRMAKELSDLRVRHREETRVVSRLTMENMNLASRCREAISQIASLRKEMLVHQKRQSEYVTLQKEVEMLRKLVGNKSSSITSVTSPSSNVRHITSITNELEQEVGGLSSPSTTNNVKQQPLISTASSTKPVSPDGEAANNRSDSPATDLDRIMSQQFRKTDKPQSSSLLSPTSISSTTPTTKGGGTLINSSSSVIAAWTVSSTAASKQSRPAAVAAANKGSNNLLLTSSNVKIPISVTSAVNSSKKHSIISTSASANTTVTSQQQQPKDDEFDVDIDMVDFFAKSQSTLLSTSNINGTSKNYTGVVGGRTHHNILGNSNKSRFGTDDIMPDDVIPISNTCGVSSGGNGGGIKGKDVSSMVMGVGVGDNLLSSLNAFEASFASAFPETSFATTTNDIAPLSTAKLDMSFDVPDFDPFFKSPSCVNNTINNNNSNHIAGMSKPDNIAGRSKPEMVLGVAARGGSATGSGDCTMDGRGGSSKNIGGSSTVSTTNKSQMIHDLFPESAMNFSIAKLDNLAFDASPMMSFEPMERTSKRGRCNNRSYQSPLSPQSMSAEIEQLDAIADLASSISGSGGGVDDGGASMSSDMAVGAPGVNSSKANINRSSVRKVKQPVSYAEPSTKAKLRRGDVLFPKMESSDKVGKAPGGGVQMTSTTELDQIMSQIASLPSPTSSLSQSHPSSET